MKIEVNASKRELQGSGASRRLRRAGKVPGVLYGGRDAAQSIELDHNELILKLKKEAFHSSVLTLVLDGEKSQVLLRDYQMHAYKPLVLHVDFQRVAADQTIHMKVPLHFVNAEVAPGVKLQGGIVSHVVSEIDVECLPGSLPEFVEVDLAHLSAGHSIHVSALSFPEGVKAVSHKGEDPVVATILLPRGTKEAELAEGEAEATPGAAANK